MNPLNYLKAIWNDPKKRPWLLVGGSATAGAAYLTLRAPTEPAEVAAENAVAEQAAGPPSTVDDGSYGAEVAGGGMHGTYVSSPPMDYDGGWEEMDFSPVFDAISEQGDALESALATEIKVERKARGRQVGQLKKVNKQQGERLDRQRKSLRQQRKDLARVRRRVKNGPKPKGKPKKGGGR